ncbi:LemA family protein [Candidatus Woesearchaeota archaeon]|nr:LemA family protein [Candidatus Woesearchaeota archaeon]
MANIVLWIIIAIIAILIIWFIAVYNRFIVLRNRISEALSQIDVQLKRRYDLIPNLVETVKGYMKHERETLTEITNARASMLKATSLKEKARIENTLAGALKTIFAVAENYPQLRATENFQMLQEELSATENKIAFSRQFYNQNVLSYNNSRQSFPGNVMAGMFNFKEQYEFFEAESEAKKPVKVKF